MNSLQILNLLMPFVDKGVRVAREDSSDVDFELNGSLVHDSFHDDPAPSEPDNHKFTVMEGTAWLSFIVSQVEECYVISHNGILRIVIH